MNDKAVNFIAKYTFPSVTRYNRNRMHKKILIPILIAILFFVIFRTKDDTAMPTRESGISEQSASTTARIPEGWQTYRDDTRGFSISYPADFEVSPNGENSIMIVKKVSEPGQGPSNFLYISTIMEGDTSRDGEIYNFNKTHLDSLVGMKINEKKPLAGESAALQEYITYKRLPDTTISGNTAQAYENMKPWEFPQGTKEYRYIVDQEDRTYLIGGYISTTSHSNYTIAEDVYKQILNTIQLPVVR